MPLLIDYSKRRAEINSSSSNINVDVSFRGYDDSESSWNDEEKVINHCRRRRPLGKNKHLDYSNGSNDTETTADTSSSSSIDDSLTEATPCTISFRIKRRSSTGLGCFLQEAEENPMEPRRILRPKRFSEPIGNNLQTTKKPVEEQAPRRRTLPDRVKSGDSIKARLQLDSWKKRQQSLLSAPAELATVSDRDLFQKPGRRGSIPHHQEFFEANHHQQQQQAPPSRIVCPNKRSSETENTRPSVPVKSISMNITRSPMRNRSASFQSRRPSKTHSLYNRSSNSSSSPSSQMLTLMNLSRALPIGQQRRRPEPTKSSTRQRRLRSNSFRTSSGLVRRGSMENLRTSSQRSITFGGGPASSSRRRSGSEPSTNSNVNLNDFVTGSRIRRLDAHPGN